MNRPTPTERPAALKVARRPTFAALLALALAAFALSACGGSGPVDGAGGATRTIVDARGDRVTVPAQPARVVALSEPTLDGALALGVKPLATTDGRGQGSISAYLQSRAKGVETVGILGQPDIEKVLALHPDLILTDGTAIQDDSLIERLEGVAPTVYVSKTGENWRTAFLAEAKALGEEGKGEALLAHYDKRVASIRSRLGANAGATVSVVRWSGVGLPDVIPAGLATGRTLAALGLKRLGIQATQGPGHAVPISLENLGQIDADWMFYASMGAGGPGGGVKVGSAGVAASRRALAIAHSTPGFDQLGVVRNGHVVVVDGSAWTSAGGLLAEEVVLDDVERALLPGSS